MSKGFRRLNKALQPALVAVAAFLPSVALAGFTFTAIEGGQMAVYTVSDPAALGTFVKVGDLLNREGELGTYATVSEIG